MTGRGRVRSAWLAVLLGSTACVFLSCVESTSIASIHDRLSNYVDKQVTVQGVVTDAGRDRSLKYYRVTDKSGEMYVISHQTLPRAGKSVRVTGVVRRNVSILGDTLTAIDEQDLRILD